MINDLITQQVGLRNRYISTGDVAAVQDAVRLGRVIVTEPVGSSSGIAWLELGVSLAVRYDVTIDVADLDAALDAFDRAGRLLPAGHPDRITVATNTIGALVQRFGVHARRGDLDRAIAVASVTIEDAGRGDHPLASIRANLAGALRIRHQMFGDPADLDRSIAEGRAAAQVVPVDAPARPMVFATLAGSLATRFKHGNRVSDLYDAAEFSQQAVAATAPGDARRITVLTVAAAILRLHFEHTGTRVSVTESVRLQREALGLLPERHPERGVHLLNLVLVLRQRFERLGVVSDLDEIFDVLDPAVESVEPLARARCLAALAEAWQARCAQLLAAGDAAGAADAAGRAVDVAERALGATPDTAAERPDRMLTLGNSWTSVFTVSGTDTARQQATAWYEATLAALGPQDPRVPSAQTSLAYLKMRDNPSLASLDEAATLLRSAVAGAIRGGPAWIRAMLNLLGLVRMRGDASPRPADSDEAAELFRRLAATPSVPAPAIAVAGVVAGELLAGARHPMAADTFATAVRALPAAAWQGIDRQSREKTLADTTGLAGSAAAAQLAGQAAGTAVELLEQARAVLWTQLLHLRGDDARLAEQHPELAARLRDISTALDV